MSEVDYASFLAAKTQLGTFDGFEPTVMPSFLFDFQQALVDWAVRKGKAAIFADCGLGKTPMQLVWAQNVVEHTNRPVLILTPLAVSHQTVAEADKFGIECQRVNRGEVHPGINVTNYERLHLFNPNDFAGCVADESSILKSFDGTRRREVTEFMRRMPFRLLCTATAAPNDYIELGTSSEALGELGHMDMLARFFKNDQHSSKPMRQRAKFTVADGKWRFKGHAEIPFWKWVCSWARAVRRPSDLGFSDKRFKLPELVERSHTVEARRLASGMLFALPAVGLQEQREERRRTIAERCEKAVELTDHDEPAIVWCHLNDEGDRIASAINGAVQVSGDDSDEVKEERFLAFQSGHARVLVTKPKIGAWGLNFQHCAHVVTFPSHSFEQYYQSVRRCWRFGQKFPVLVDVVTTEGEQSVLANLQRKSVAADKMFSDLVSYMHEAVSIDRGVTFRTETEVPTWL